MVPLIYIAEIQIVPFQSWGPKETGAQRDVYQNVWGPKETGAQREFPRNLIKKIPVTLKNITFSSISTCATGSIE